ncbi:MAG: glycosyltransferase [Planctomycetota bacterium]|nr:glycosyltransferase [Planctomycetota bacterium]
MTARPLVSILIPAFDAARWIQETLESALAQTWRSLEVIVVDDGSGDETAALVERYAGRGVRLIRQENRGPSAAQNAALRAASGDFIQYLDADDLLSPTKVELQLARLTGAPGAIASGEWGRFHGSPAAARFEPETVWRDLAATEWLVEACAGGRPMMQPGIWLLPRRVVERAGPWDERLTLINDMEYFARVLLAADEVRFVPGARLYYRSGNPASVGSRRTPEAWRSALLALELTTAALFDRRSDDRARRACADLFQEWLFAAEAEAPRDVVERLEERLALLGGSSLQLDGGPALRALSRAIGWRAARRVQRWAHARGFGRVASKYRTLAARAGRGRSGAGA